jgi:uncharacterized protein (DUF2141 family)
VRLSPLPSAIHVAATPLHMTLKGLSILTYAVAIVESRCAKNTIDRSAAGSPILTGNYL